MFLKAFYSLFIVLTVGYALFLLLVLIGLYRLREGNSGELPRVSVIVAARNEEENIGACVRALAAQQYPQDRYEVVVVDDHSEDGTAETVSRLGRDYENVKLVQVGERSFVPSPKKNAILCGMGESTGEVILTTDADCIPPPGWISGMVKYFDPQVGAVVGFSPALAGSSLKQKLIELESVSFAIVSAGAIGWGEAISCVGRNFAYRREAFEEVEGFGAAGQAISGDDDLLLQRIRRRGNWKIRFANCPETFVPTISTGGWNEFVNRRKRHFSAGISYPPALRVLGGIIYIYYFVLLLSLPVALASGIFWIPLLCWGAKLLWDTAAVSKGLRLFRNQRLLAVLPLAEVLHIPYLLVVWPLAIWGGFQWKERAYR